MGRSDYYGQEERGLWAGKGAQMLGLRGEVSREQFVALANNQRPDSKGRLTARTNGTRTETRRVFDPKTQIWQEKEIEVSNRRAGYDICLSAPKSVSLYLAMTGDKDVERMLREAAAETMSAMEANMETRLRGEDEEGRNRDDENRTTGNMVYAAFLHRETRPIEGKCDPHAHLHCYVFNATFDHEENRWKAAQLGNIKADGPWYEAVFHARLADKLEAAGLGIQRTDRNFELASVSRELVEKFSKRTLQIERLARDQSTKVEARTRALMKETGLDYGDAYAKVKHDLGAESREKMILSGDTRQHHSVERGDALRVLESVGAVSQVVLTKIFRQLDPAQRAAIYDLSEGETACGFDKLKSLGAIVEISDPSERLQKLSEKHLQALKDGVTTLIVTPTHEEGRMVTTVVRDQMKQEGLITGQEHVVGRLQKLNLSVSQQRSVWP